MRIDFQNGAGFVEVTCCGDYFELSEEDKRFIEEIARMFREYATVPHSEAAEGEK